MLDVFCSSLFFVPCYPVLYVDDLREERASGGVPAFDDVDRVCLGPDPDNPPAY
jgi:hypothetical protein